jgi:hypothetical protein
MKEVMTAMDTATSTSPETMIVTAIVFGVACLFTVTIPMLNERKAVKVPLIPLPALHLFVAASLLCVGLLTEMGAAMRPYADTISTVVPAIAFWRYFVNRKYMVLWFRVVGLRRTA